MIYTVTLNPALDKELLVHALELDTVLRSQEVRIDYGGKGFNVSRMISALGGSSVALAFAGGHNGEILRSGLDSLGIDTDFVWVAEETRTNVSIVTATGGHYIKVNEQGPTIPPTAYVSLVDKVKALTQPDDWWVLAGSLPPGVPAAVYADLTAKIQGAGAYVVLDTSGAALGHGCSTRPFLVKPNDVEIQQLTGLPVKSTTEIAAAAHSLQQSGIANVVVSLGKDGALLINENGLWRAESPRVEERNPIGAGDSLVGGLVWGLSEGLDVPEALRWGIACGAATASLSGTAVGSVRCVEKLLPQVPITELPI